MLIHPRHRFDAPLWRSVVIAVCDVCDRYGVVQDGFFFGQEKTDREVAPALTWTAREVCQRWIDAGGKRRDHFLFTGSKKQISDRHINDDTYRKRVKAWAEILKLNPESYSTHSLRRSKPHFMYRRGAKIEYISELLGHKNTATTYRYLGITREEAREQALAHDIFKKSLHRIGAGGCKRIDNPCADLDIFAAGFEDLREDVRQIKASLGRIEAAISDQNHVTGKHSQQLISILAKFPDRRT